MHSRLGEKSVDFLDSPVTGGDKGAREGTLTIMVGGKREVFDRCRPVFEGMGKEIVYMGDSGSGQAMKLCNQTAVAIHTLATCESLLLGSSEGLNSKDVLKVLTSGAANSWNLTNLGPKVVTHDYEPGFKAAHLLKDLRYVIQLSEKNRSRFPEVDGVPALQLNHGGKRGGEGHANPRQGPRKTGGKGNPVKFRIEFRCKTSIRSTFLNLQ